MKKKLTALTLALVLGLSALLTGCGSSAKGSAASSEAASQEHPMILTLAHNQAENHPVHKALVRFADQVKERTNGRIVVKIYPNGQLGSENENLEQLQAGVVAMAKVSAPNLATYNDGYNTFGLPYIFNDQADYYKVMDSKQMDDFFMSSADDGFLTMTYYDSGSRSFYTKGKAIRTPSDLNGLKIRVQDMAVQTDMMKSLGGTPVTMSYGDVYTSLQTGIIDGSENNVTALTTGKHGEVAKYYSVDEHEMIPDALVMSSKVWSTLSMEDQAAIKAAARESTEYQKGLWAEATKKAVEQAKQEMGVTFIYDVDKAAFQQATAPMIQTYENKYPGVKRLMQSIEQAREVN